MNIYIENLIYQTENQLKENQDKLKKEDYDLINSKLTDLKDCKDSDDKDKIKSAIESLNTEWSKVSQNLYNASQGENSETPDNPKSKGASKEKNDGNVENVDYEVVDDEKDN